MVVFSLIKASILERRYVKSIFYLIMKLLGGTQKLNVVNFRDEGHSAI